MIEELLFFPKITSLSKEILPFQDEFSNQYLHLHTNSIPFPSPQKREIKNFKTRQQISRKIHLHPPQKLLEHRPRTRELKAILSQDPLNAPLSLSLSLFPQLARRISDQTVGACSKERFGRRAAKCGNVVAGFRRRRRMFARRNKRRERR